MAAKGIPKARRFGVSNFVGNLLNRNVGRFEHLLGFLYSKRLHVFDRGLPRCASKPPEKTAFAQTGPGGHCRNWRRVGVVIRNPRLCLGHKGVIMLLASEQ